MKDTFAEFEARFADLKLDERTLELSHDKTIVPERRAYRSTRDVLQALPRMTLGGAEIGLGGDLRVKGKLGEGGMGMVQLAEQSPLDRLVAVKTPLRTGDEHAVHALLQEAYITGIVEHPNVVPIYTLGKSDKGDPLIVMKRIEGVSWAAVLKDPAVIKDDEVDLSWHLRILLQVCDALRYAHNQGIVHRDIKPENVMIGRFGEVYLLDWGIAVSLVPSDNPMLRHVSEAAGVAGTPSYMAPEMTDDTADGVDVRTDVYLLGATLHELLTGEPRHTGESMMKVFFKALQSEPVEYGPEVPRDLAWIANKATAAEKSDRFATVEAFQQAIEDFLEHRASYELSEVADRDWEKVQVLLGRDREDRDELELHNLFAECRLGYRQALRLWAENQLARQGLQRCLAALARHYIATRNDVGAAAAVAEMPEPDASLQAEIANLAAQRAVEEAEMARLRRFSATNDMTKGSTTRSVLAVVLGLFWGWSNFYAQNRMLAGEIEDPILDHLMATPKTVGIAVVLIVVFRKKLFSNAANARVMYVLIITLVAMSCARIAAYMLNAEIIATQAAETFLWALCASMLGVVTDLRITLASSVLYLAGFAGVMFPAYQLYPMGVASMLFFAYLAFLWRRPAAASPGV